MIMSQVFSSGSHASALAQEAKKAEEDFDLGGGGFLLDKHHVIWGKH